MTLAETAKTGWVEIVKYVFFVGAFFLFSFAWFDLRSQSEMDRARLDQHEATIAASQKEIADYYRQLLAARLAAREASKTASVAVWNAEVAHTENMKRFDELGRKIDALVKGK